MFAQEEINEGEERRVDRYHEYTLFLLACLLALPEAEKLLLSQTGSMGRWEVRVTPR